MQNEEFITEYEFNHFRLRTVSDFQRDIQRYAKSMLATRDAWLAVAPSFEDFHALQDILRDLELVHVGRHEQHKVISLIRLTRGHVEMAMGLHAIWCSCAYSVHDQIVRNNRLPEPIDVTAWAYDYGQQLSLLYRRYREQQPHRSKHRGGQARRVPQRKKRKRN